VRGPQRLEKKLVGSTTERGSGIRRQDSQRQ
jgi:hypothetical protein